ncbi:MAG TPA: FHA domain-containing protein [Gemmataceae bacterium]|jgi:MFS family permease|nr:FHA domain-containing protein [Gemmataceae bacterium]
MTFRLFIYYCALCGGWAAFLAFVLVQALGIRRPPDEFVPEGRRIVLATLTSGILGVLLAGAVGAIDALLNAVGSQRLIRVLVCLAVGLLGGLLAGLLGALLWELLSVPRFLDWTIVGMVIGASIGVFDLGSALSAGQGPRMALRKVINGVIGGALGGFVGGLFFVMLEQVRSLPRSSLATGFVILGVCIGLLIGLAQIILKEAWIRVEQGFRAGREMMLSKGAMTIGRSESSDIGIFGDNAVEKVHARILLQGNRYVVADAGTPSGTFVNDERITQAVPLRSGDQIRIGNNVLRFRERQKRA